MRRPYFEEYCDRIDSTVFSGDMLYCDEDREMFKECLARWTKAVLEHELFENQAANQQATERSK